MNLSPHHKIAGILEPVFAMRTETDLGIGDTGAVRQMMDWCRDHGLNILQTLPINETGENHSPYDALSSLAIDPVTIELSPRVLPDLTAADFKKIATPKLLLELRQGPVNYTKVKVLKRTLLQAAFAVFFKKHFNVNTARAREFRKFLNENGEWLPNYALYRVLMEENGNRSAWERWRPEHQTPHRTQAWLLSLPEKQRIELARRQIFFMYVQWIAFSQWRALRAHGDARKVYLMGDIPFGVGRHSADVWANRALFDLDWSGGAPPERFFKVDLFTEKWGQNWGIANYDWEEMRRRHFSWWRTRVGNIRQAFHLCRIDHAPGFFRIYSFPWTPEYNGEFAPLDETQAAARTRGRLPGFRPFPDDTYEHKAANEQRGEEILRVVLEAAGDMVIVAEDLGVVPDYMPAALQRLNIPGFRIPSFFRGHGGRYADPAHYPRLSLAQPATHDHAPLAAAWAERWKNIDDNHEPEENRRELRHMMDFAGIDDAVIPRVFGGRLHEEYLRALLRANSWLAVTMITDVFGQELRFNVPGSVGSANWSARLPWTVRELDKNPELLACTNTYERLAREAGRGH